MQNILRLFLIFSCALWLSGVANAQFFLTADQQTTTVCPAFETDTAPPPTTREGCQNQSMWAADPQDNHIWLLLDFPVEAISNERPLGLAVSAKAASLVYWNGALIGKNGLPADTRAAERVGKMDRIYPISAGQIKTGANKVAIRMSSHAGLLHLNGPIHGVFLTKYVAPEDMRLRAYWPTILPFGAFALGALYFLTTALIGRQRVASGLLGVMSLAAGVQLLAEVSRGLTAYDYPFHDARLIIIATCSAIFGLALATYVVRQFQWHRRVPIMAGVGLAVAGALLLPGGLDLKASYALLVPTLLAAGVALSALSKMRSSALLFAGFLLAFAAINFLGAGYFLDRYFFYAVALLMLFLFAQQAKAFAQETNFRHEEEARADKLQYVLDQLQEGADEPSIAVKSAGRISTIASKDIAFVKGAGDYAELVLPSGEAVLHHATLTDLEAELPAYFLRVHRSYLVNSRLIASLERHTSGTGELRLKTDQTLPVSRRIMPKIRAALIAG